MISSNPSGAGSDVAFVLPWLGQTGQALLAISVPELLDQAGQQVGVHNLAVAVEVPHRPANVEVERVCNVGIVMHLMHADGLANALT